MPPPQYGGEGEKRVSSERRTDTAANRQKISIFDLLSGPRTPVSLGSKMIHGWRLPSPAKRCLQRGNLKGEGGQ